ncbi:MAG: M61 family metallopeptidase [Bacteroidales bacterium]|nr:M61 family metallopeptidase [Bacteroidales bacterium]
MKHIFTLILFALVLPSTTVANGIHSSMRYTVDLDTVGKYLNVELEYTSTAPSPEVLLKMPVWAPGYYMIQNFPKHLCDFTATDSEGRSIKWTKEGKNGWRIVLPDNGKAKVRYRIFADEYDVASSRIDSKAAFIAPNGVFMYEEGKKDSPVTISYTVPSNWKSVSTGLLPDKGKLHTYTSPNFDVLYDSPLLMGNHLVKKFRHEGHDYELALETPDGFEESGFEDCFRKIVSTATQIVQDVPYSNYTLIHMGKGLGGLEHLNSQACYTDGSFRFNDRSEWLNYLALTAHEYFHLYNVKTIRPIELGPFDYDREVFTPLLWFSEGITCYYEAQILHRAGLATEEEMYELISKYMRMDERYEGHHHQSLRQTSYDIWLTFLNEDKNYKDVTINYYFRGPAVGLIMDLEIQRLSNKKHSLDDLMRLLYNRYHKAQGRGFNEEEFWTAVDEVAGASMSHIRYIVDNPVDIDYEKYLTPAGLILDRNTWTIKPHN